MLLPILSSGYNSRSMDIYKQFEYQFNLPASIPFNKLVNLRHLVFEVTTKCNLNCTYCGYGPLYDMRTHNDRVNMPLYIAKNLIDYLYHIWATNLVDYDIVDTFIGFYGGEPLLNFDFISSVISYLESRPLASRVFSYTMTTNAMLLDKYMDFLTERKFHLVISLDGNKIAHSYRVDHRGQNSFDKVYKNVKELQAKYPDYFEKYVTFNSVLTNRGELFSVKEFISTEFQKDSMIAEVNDFGVLECKKSAFNRIHRSILKDISQKSKEEIDKVIPFAKNPSNSMAFQILKNLSNNCYRSYNALLPHQEGRYFPTGTCFPFDKKMFVNVKGELFPCERVNQKYSLGTVTENDINIDYEYIARIYSERYKRVYQRCRGCFAKPICEQCMFYIDDLDTNPSCPNFMTKEQYDELINKNMSYLSDNPEAYQRIMKEMF